MEEETPIAAIDHAKPEAPETDSAIAKIVGFPLALGDATESEENPGDLAVAGILETSVDNTQRQDEPFSARLRQCGTIATGIASGQCTPKADRGHRADLEQMIEGQEHGRRFRVAPFEMNAE
jgi:hypothetical protein